MRLEFSRYSIISKLNNKIADVDKNRRLASQSLDMALIGWPVKTRLFRASEIKILTSAVIKAKADTRWLVSQLRMVSESQNQVVVMDSDSELAKWLF